VTKTKTTTNKTTKPKNNNKTPITTKPKHRVHPTPPPKNNNKKNQTTKTMKSLPE